MTLLEKILFAGAEALLVDSEAQTIEMIADDHAKKFASYVAENPEKFNNGLSMEDVLKEYKTANKL